MKTMQQSDMITEGESRTKSVCRNDSNEYFAMTIDQIKQAEENI